VGGQELTHRPSAYVSVGCMVPDDDGSGTTNTSPLACSLVQSSRVRCTPATGAHGAPNLDELATAVACVATAHAAVTATEVSQGGGCPALIVACNVTCSESSQLRVCQIIKAVLRRPAFDVDLLTLFDTQHDD
jgi:hypothetical protein